MNFKYTAPTREEVVDFILLVIGFIIVVLHENNYYLAFGILLMVSNINGSLGKISIKKGSK